MLNDTSQCQQLAGDADRNTWSATLRAAIVASAAMVLCAWLVWLIVPGKWVARGYPSYIGYAKNVEHAALLVGALAGASIALVGLGRPIGWGLTAPLSLGGFGVALYYGRPETAWALPLMIALVALYFTCFQGLRRPGIEPPPPEEPWPRRYTAGLSLALAMVCFAQAVWPIPLDGFHQGEVLLTALDWLKGGKPFETIFWPHGMHDTWLTAKLMEATGNNGIGSVVLSRALTHLLGLVTLQVTAVCLLRRHADALLMTALVTLVMPHQIYQLGVAGFAILPLAVLARRTNVASCLVVGGLLGWAFLWRFDSGLFGLAAALSYVVLSEFYGRFAAGATLRDLAFDRQCWLRAAGCMLTLLTGVAACFAVTRLVLGLPTWKLFSLTLLELPRYHADNTGFPLSLPIERFDGFLYQDFIWTRWFTPAYLLFAVLMVATLARMMWLRRYSLSLLSDRYFLAFGLFVLFHTKSVLDRAGPHRMGFALMILGLLVAFDLLARLPTARMPARFRLACSAAVGLVCFGVVLPQPASIGKNGIKDSVAGLQAAYQAVRYPRTTFHHFRNLVTPTTNWQDLLEPTRYEHKEDLHHGVREARSLLASQHVGDRRLAIVHSGPIFYPVLGIEPATRYYMLGWAMNDAMERQAVDEMQSNRLQAMLRVNGLGNVLAMYDLPDEYRVPIIDEYLKQRTATWPMFYTRLGGLHIDAAACSQYWSLASEGAHWSVHESATSYPLVPGSVQGYIDVLAADGEDAIAIAGWGADVAAGVPASRLLVMAGDQVVLAFAPYCERSDVAEAFSKPGLRFCGFHLRLPKKLFAAHPQGNLRLLAVSQTSAAEIPVPGRVPALAAQPVSNQSLK